jgi:hypothetical protein
MIRSVRGRLWSHRVILGNKNYQPETHPGALNNPGAKQVGFRLVQDMSQDRRPSGGASEEAGE